ncbi:MAG: lactoylglutathione lyase [Gammaproteobacteria bacterium]|jgi:lactoylglutathione lyase
MSHPSLVPELYCTDIGLGVAFYNEVLGFSVLYERPEHHFAYLQLGPTELMLEQPINGERTWLTGPLEKPFGRGKNLATFMDDIDPLLTRLCKTGRPLFLPVEERWYRRDDQEVGNRQFVVQDPDGYLLRFCTDLGSRVDHAPA